MAAVSSTLTVFVAGSWLIDAASVALEAGRNLAAIARTAAIATQVHAPIQGAITKVVANNPSTTPAEIAAREDSLCD